MWTPVTDTETVIVWDFGSGHGLCAFHCPRVWA